MMRRTTHVVRFGACVFALFAVGCGSSDDRLPVRGTVSVDGQAVSSGSIAFRPIDPAIGASSGGVITNGEFWIPAEKGLGAGDYRVEILAMKRTGKSVNDPVFGPTELEQQILPPKFNTQSELTTTISADTADDLVFDLKSR